MDILWLAPLETKETISRVVYFLNVSNGLLLLSFHNSVVLQIWWSLQHCLVLWGLVYFYCQPGSGTAPELSLLNYVPLFFLLPLRSTVPRGLSLSHQLAVLTCCLFLWSLILSACSIRPLLPFRSNYFPLQLLNARFTMLILLSNSSNSFEIHSLTFAVVLKKLGLDIKSWWPLFNRESSPFLQSLLAEQVMVGRQGAASKGLSCLNALFGENNVLNCSLFSNKSIWNYLSIWGKTGVRWTWITLVSLQR